MTIENEIKEMEELILTDGDEDVIVEDDPNPDPIIEDPYKEDLDADKLDKEKDPDPDPDPDAEDPPPVKEPPVEDPNKLELMQTEIDNLKSKLEEKEKKVPEEEPPPPPEEVPIKDIDFINGADVEDILTDGDKLNQILNAAYKKGVEYTRSEIKEGNIDVMRSIPDIIKNNMQIQSAMTVAREKFYAENSDLAPFKKVVATVFQEISSDNPDKNYQDILSMVGDEARKRLELHKKAVKIDKENSPPKLPQKRGQQRITKPKPNTDPMTSELNAMDQALNN